MPPGYHLEDFFEGLYTAQKRLAKLRSPVSSPDGFEVDFNEELLMVTTEEPTQSTSRRRAKEVVIDLNKKSVDFIVSPTTSIPPTDTPHVRDLQELGVGEVGEESSGEGMEIGVPKVQRSTSHRDAFC